MLNLITTVCSPHLKTLSPWSRTTPATMLALSLTSSGGNIQKLKKTGKPSPRLWSWLCWELVRNKENLYKQHLILNVFSPDIYWHRDLLQPQLELYRGLRILHRWFHLPGSRALPSGVSLPSCQGETRIRLPPPSNVQLRVIWFNLHCLLWYQFGS